MNPSSTKLILAALAAPLLFNLLLFVATRLPTPIKPSSERPAVYILPFVGISIFPLVVWFVRGSFLLALGSARKVLGVLFLTYCTLHLILTVLYGNINNEAFSDSWIIDVSAPKNYWNEIINIESQFRISTRSTGWSKSISGPHLPSFTCDDHIFIRFMCHRTLSKSRVSSLLGDGIMFCGAWVMVELTKGGPPKVFTDFAYGNDIPFNRIIVQGLYIDTRNIYNTFNNSLLDDKGIWDIRSIDVPPLYKGPYEEHMEATGKKFPANSTFVQDQYSCMNEALWLRKIYGEGWCFYKMMEAAESFELRGTITNPLLKQTLAFPTGDNADCTKPMVRAVFAKDLHWRRDNYLC